MTLESIISASVEDLLFVPGVGISFIKNLRKTLGKHNYETILLPR